MARKLQMNHRNILLLVSPFLVFLLLTIVYFLYFEMSVINYFDCGCFTHGISYRIANTCLLLLITALYEVLYLASTRKISNRIMAIVSYVINSFIVIVWTVYLLFL